MNIIDYTNFSLKKISIFKSKSSNGFYIFPIKYDKKQLIVKAPLLNVPYGVTNSYNKQYLTLSFPTIFTKKHIQFYRCLLKIDKWVDKISNQLIRFINQINKSKQNYKKIYKKDIQIKKIIDNSKYDPMFTMNINEYTNCYDIKNNKIDRKNTLKDLYLKSLCYISGIWFHNNQFGLLIHCLQLKILPNITKCLVLNEEEENNITICLTKEDLKLPVIKKQISCLNCDEKITLTIKNKEYQSLQNASIQQQSSSINPRKSVSIANIPVEYQKFYKMKQVGVPLMAIKQKLLMEGLDYKTFIDITTKPSSKTITLSVSHQHKPKPKLLNFKDLLSQKNKLKKTKRKLRKPKKQTKWYQKNQKVPSLQEILQSLKTLKKVKKNLNLS